MVTQHPLATGITVHVYSSIAFLGENFFTEKNGEYMVTQRPLATGITVHVYYCIAFLGENFLCLEKNFYWKNRSICGNSTPTSAVADYLEFYFCC